MSGLRKTDLDKRPPLALYIHIPWCVQKCPYCDFNSHTLGDDVDESAYVDALLADLEQDLPSAGGRPLESIFIGGGTPSLFSDASIGRLLAGVRECLGCVTDMEVTLEANPGTVEHGRFAGYREAGVTRLSLGIQSFNSLCLRRIGRIHDGEESINAVRQASCAGVRGFNVDLMFGLPGQSLAQARADLQMAISLRPSHISYYQMTLEPNTRFYNSPPSLPDEDLLWEMQLQGQALLAGAGYRQYEVSAYAQGGHKCVHNLNYWQFGDYLGLGAGAHGKTTTYERGLRVTRTRKVRHPAAYLRKAGSAARISGCRILDPEELPVEFMLNALRMSAGFDLALFERHTGLGRDSIGTELARARKRGLVEQTGTSIRPTALGSRYLNDLIALFDPGP